MKYLRIFFLLVCLAGSAAAGRAGETPKAPEIVHFPSGDLTLGGELFLPDSDGPFPVVLYNHGSAPGMANSMASASIGPKFAENGWAFFMPYRRGQGLSEDQGPYIMDAIKGAWWNPFDSAAEKLVELHEGVHLDDQMAALQWLRKQPFADPARIATAGNSFGGIQVMLGMARADYCAGINAAGAARAWGDSEGLQTLLKNAAATANGPVFFYQAENDYHLAPSKALFSAMEEAGLQAELKIYPPFGSSKQEGHSLAYRGVSIWFEDALRFLNTQCGIRQRNNPVTLRDGRASKPIETINGKPAL